VKVGPRRADTSFVATTNLATAAVVGEFQPGAIAEAPIGGRVVIIDQQAMVAESLALVLHTAEVTTSITRETGLEAVVRHVRAFDPDLVLVGATSSEAVDTVRTLTRAGVKVVVVTDGTDRIRVAACIEAGATGAVATSDPVDTLLNAVRETVAGRRLLSPTTERDLLGELQLHRRDHAMRLAKFTNLSNRESEVLWALMMGKSAAEIAEESYVSIATIRSQIKAILRKLEVNSQLAAVALAYQAGWARDAFRTPGGSPARF
jgi:DNA-binding NarL/FixJ family response regulator